MWFDVLVVSESSSAHICFQSHLSRRGGLRLNLRLSTLRTRDTSDEYGSNPAWSASELAVHYDAVTVDSAFLTNLSEQLKSGASLQMQFKGYSAPSYSLLSHSAQLTNSRSASRLNSSFISFYGANAEADQTTRKQCNHLSLPASSTLKARIQMGERRWPAIQDMKGLGMFFRKLITTVSNNRAFHAPSIDRRAFASRSFIYATDSENASEVQQSGTNTNTRSLSIFLENLYAPTVPLATQATRVFITSFADRIMVDFKTGRCGWHVAAFNWTELTFYSLAMVNTYYQYSTLKRYANYTEDDTPRSAPLRRTTGRA